MPISNIKSTIFYYFTPLAAQVRTDAKSRPPRRCVGRIAKLHTVQNFSNAYKCSQSYSLILQSLDAQSFFDIICAAKAFVSACFGDNFCMKRICVAMCFFAAVVGVMLCFVPQPFCKAAVRFPKQCQVSIFCRKTSCPATNLGNGFLVECRVENLMQTLELCGGVDGLSVKIGGNEQLLREILQKLRVKTVHSQNLQGLTVVCGYSSAILGAVFVDGKKVNVQVAFDGEIITVGSPLILDSF